MCYDALNAAIRFALDQVSADDCAGWFSYCTAVDFV